MRVHAQLWGAGLAVVLGGTLPGQQPAFKVSPASLAFSYIAGDAKLPATQTLSVSSTPPGVAFTAVVSGGPWLTMSPPGGATPVPAKVAVNPTTLAVGNYAGTIELTTAGSAPQTISVPVTLSIKAPPAQLDVSPATINVTYTRGTPAPAPASLALSTTGGVLSYTATAGGGSWLSISPKSGAVFPGFPAALAVTISPAELAPGSYKGTITIGAPLASNKSTAVTVNLTVEPGRPVLSSIWPTQVTQGAGPTTLTLQGDYFVPGTRVKAGISTLTATLLGTNLMTAVIPAGMLAAAGTLSITVTNLGSGGGDSLARTLTVLSSTPTINAIANAASLKTGSIAPGQMLVLFGTALGPDSLAVFAPPASGQPIATMLAGTRVLFGTTPAPVIYASATQTAVLAPYDLAGKTSVAVKVEYNSVQSNAVSANVAASQPGLFTLSGNGAGQAVAFNYDAAKQTYTLNGDSAQAAKGSIVVLYATGYGVPSPAVPDGHIVTQASTQVPTNVVVHIGGSDAAVLYAGGVVGLTAGIMQLNVQVPEIPAGKTTPVKLIVNGIASQDGATISVK
jgi:uncharacterized protein (TIGR03437 family)